MAPMQTTRDFLNLVQRSRLLSREQIKTAIEQAGLERLPSPLDAADALVQQQVLTRYQVKRLLEGRRRGLFLENYKILEILGCGGMGYLYAAEELPTGWKVAVKVLSDRHRHDKGRLTRFQLEAEAGLKLVHPNILRTRAIKRTEDIYGSIHFMVLELVRGISLFELLSIRKRTLHWRQACDVIWQAANGLHYAHQQGLVHRDVKPENLLIRADGTIKVLDFGLAMIRGSDAEYSIATILGQNCLGTADYIAPEQSKDSLEVDLRADIYSLGCTFYFLVTGRPPFTEKSNAKKLLGHRQLQPPRVSELNPKCPRKVVQVIEKMMAKQPAKRFANCQQLMRYLEPMSERQPVEFDFEAVLARRAKVAERRLASESVLRGDSRTKVSRIATDVQESMARPNRS